MKQVTLCTLGNHLHIVTELSSSLLRQLEERDRQKATLEMEGITSYFLLCLCLYNVGLKQMKILRGEKEALIREKEALMLRHLTVTERNHAQSNITIVTWLKFILLISTNCPRIS